MGKSFTGEFMTYALGDFRNAPITKPDGKFFGFLKGPRDIEYTLLVFLVGASQIRHETAQNRNFVQPSQWLQGGNNKTQWYLDTSVMLSHGVHKNQAIMKVISAKFSISAGQTGYPKSFTWDETLVPREKTSIFPKGPWSRRKTFRICRLASGNGKLCGNDLH